MQSGGIIAPVTARSAPAPALDGRPSRPPPRPASSSWPPPSACSPNAASPGVSVRTIAAEAGVNWSLVGYYFRGKDGLLAEVYRRHCTTLNAERLRLLSEARRAGLTARVRDRGVRPAGARRDPGQRRPESVLSAARHAGGRRRLRSSRSSSPTTSTSPAARSSPRSASACRTCPRDEVLWRFHFMLGTIYYSASSPQRIKAFSRGRCDPGDVEATVRHLVPFLATAFRSAPVATPAAANAPQVSRARRRATPKAHRCRPRAERLAARAPLRTLLGD